MCDCPHCGYAIDVDWAWSRNEYECDFDLDCPNCRTAIGCHVDFSPSFSLSSKTTEEQARERFARFQPKEAAGANSN